MGKRLEGLQRMLVIVNKLKENHSYITVKELERYVTLRDVQVLFHDCYGIWNRAEHPCREYRTALQCLGRQIPQICPPASTRTDTQCLREEALRRNS